MLFELSNFDLEKPSYADFRLALKNSGIPLVHDDEDLGFLGFFWNGFYGGFTRDEVHFFRMPLFFYEPETDDFDKLDNRQSLDQEFEKSQALVSSQLNQEPILTGLYCDAHNPETDFYRYSVWQLKHCRLALQQDEFDIQFGFDVSLRFVYQDGDIETLLY